MRLVILTLLFASNVIFAQESPIYLKFKKNPRYWDGYVVEKNGEKTWGLIKRQDDDKLSSKVSIVFKDGKKKTFNPSHIDGYGYMGRDFVSTGKRFLEVVTQGKRISVYKAIVVFQNTFGAGGQGMPMMHEAELYYFKKTGDDKFQSFEKSGFKKEIGSYFSDCEMLKDKILSGELTHKDFSKIAYLYNYECK
jgi:hypothetical protein